MTTTPVRPAPDEQVLEELLGRVIGDLGATMSAPLVVIGDRLGLYRAIANGGSATAEELAEWTGTSPVYLKPWLANQAAGGYLTYDPQDERYGMTPEQVAVLADEASPAFFAASFELALGALRDTVAIQERFGTGVGFGWHEHHPDLFLGTERFFRPGYAANLVPVWLPALDDVVAKMTAGARVADVGCGHGASTVLMAEAFPRSTFLGTDYHEGSIRVARRRAAEAGVADRTRFEPADAVEMPDGGFDLITMFDCLHDMGDPGAAARAARRALADDGTLMVVEPAAGDTVLDNLNPIGRVFYAGSTLICTPASLAQPGAAALGAQAGPARLTAVLADAGFTRVRVAAQSPVNLVFEARP
jgi:SAM-dependent methyltransferase